MKAEKQQKTAVFGGSFDPPHYGHIDIVKNLERTFDRVIVVPSFISPFKAEGADDAAARLKLCKKAFASEKTEVLSREIKKGGVSYSVDTAAYLAKKYKSSRLTWVIGSEELGRLIEWHDIDRLKTLVDFLVVPRPRYDVDPDTLAVLKKLKIKIKVAKFVGLDVSSTEIKLDTAFGKPNKYMPSAVKEYADKNGLFDPYGAYVDALYAHGLKDKRIAHTYGVAVKGAELAKLFGCSVHDCVVACLLHDIAKSTDIGEYKDKLDLSGFPEPTAHSAIGAYIAETEFGVSDEIAHAIYVHSTGDDKMTALDEAVFLADKTERGRNYDGVNYIRYLCGYDRRLAMLYMLKRADELRDTLPCEMSERAKAYYEALCDGVEFPAAPERAPRKPVAKAPKPVGSVDSHASADKEKTEERKPVAKRPTHLDHDADFARSVAEAAAKELDLHKAHDIDVIDLGGKTIIADHFVIASATSSTAVRALANYVEDVLTKKFGLDPSKRDTDREWIALDYGSVIVHIFTDQTREFYNIERLWADGGNIKRYGD